MNWKSLLFSFEGRVGRGPYWIYFVVMLVVLGGLTALGMMTALNAESRSSVGGMTSLPMTIAMLVMIWPSVAILAKRWHDVDKSAWWILIALVPVVGGIVALVFNGFIAGTPGTNRFGPPPADGSASAAAIARS